MLVCSSLTVFSVFRLIKDGIIAGIGWLKEKEPALTWLSFILKLCFSFLQQLSFLAVSLLVLSNPL
jgi:hypothetical protein